MTTALPKRFYTDVATAPLDGGFQILLDGRPVRTPARGILLVPTPALAEAIRAEWQAQEAVIDPASQPMTRMTATTQDRVVPQRAAVIATLAEYGDSDLVCYRAAEPEGLATAQAAAWDPLIAWAATTGGPQLRVTVGIMPIAQDAGSATLWQAWLERLDDAQLAVAALTVPLLGSLVLGLAVTSGHLGAPQALAAAHIDHAWQAAKWGETADYRERRTQEAVELEEAIRFLELTRP